MGKHTKKRKLVDINVIIAAIAKEIKRIHDESTAPYAPTAGTYKRLRVKGDAPTIDKNLKRAGYGLTAVEWRRFVRDKTGLDVEPPEVTQRRRNEAIKIAHRELGDTSSTGITDRWTTGVHRRGDLDTLPSEGMPVVSVKTDDNGWHWCMLR